MRQTSGQPLRRIAVNVAKNHHSPLSAARLRFSTMVSQWILHRTLSSTKPNSSPVDSCLLHEQHAKHAKWYAFPLARRTQSLAYICRPQRAHLVPNLLWGREKERRGRRQRENRMRNYWRVDGVRAATSREKTAAADYILNLISGAIFKTVHAWSYT